MMSSRSLDLVKIKGHFERSLHGEDDVLLDEYVEGYREINKFFELIGPIFNFVSSDIKDKIKILEQHRLADYGDKFSSFRSMIEHEQQENLLKKANYVSGARTLLRLHRGLDFIREFLGRIPNLAPEDKTAAICQEAYNDTLAKFHPWIIRKGAVVAMYALPTRAELLAKTHINQDEAVQLLPSMLESTKLVYDRTDSLYTIFDLHQLP